MRKEREINIKVIKVDRINNKRLAEFFSKKFTEQSREGVQK